MANQDKLVFPIGFDLESGVKQVEHDWEKTYRKRLQSVIDSKPIKIKLDFDANGVHLKDYKEYIALSKQAAQLAKENARVREAEAKAREREARATQQASNARVAENTEAERTRRIKDQAALTEEKLRQAKERSARATNTQNSAYKTQSAYLQRLVQRMLAYASVTQVIQFLRNIREVTAEFELQRVALGAIIGDANRANALFEQIKAAAVKSPFQVKELVTYTKQLAAYKIETEDLFETTQKLADISAGLGISMERLILAYGQIRATGYLRASEVRQLTEAGIPIVEELAKKMSEFRNETISAADVMQMISERAISFEQVKEVFDDMTSAGGMFYKMQEKQSKTLAGQISNLKDSFAIMYDEIGRSEEVNGAMSSMIGLLKTLAENWRIVWGVLKGIGIAYGSIKVASFFLPTLTVNTNKVKRAEDRLARAISRRQAAQRKGGIITVLVAKQQEAAARSTLAAEKATSKFGKAWARIKGIGVLGWLGAGISLLAIFVSYLIAAYQQSQRLNRELARIDTEARQNSLIAVNNFTRLANVVRDAADGSREQTDALKELKRQYGDLLPMQDSEIKNLLRTEQGYNNVVNAIKQKIALQAQEQKISAIVSEKSEIIGKKQSEFRELGPRVSPLYSPENVDKIFEAVTKAIQEGRIRVTKDVKSTGEVLSKLIEEEVGLKLTLVKFHEGKFGSSDYWYYWGHTAELLRDAALAAQEMKDRTDAVVDSMANQTLELGKFTEKYKEFKDKYDKISSDKPKYSFEYDEEMLQKRLDHYRTFVNELLEEAKKIGEKNGGISETLYNELLGMDNLDQVMITLEKNVATMTPILRQLRSEYAAIFPNSQAEVIKRSIISVAGATGLSMDIAKRYMKRNNESISQWEGRLKTDMENAAKDVLRFGAAWRVALNQGNTAAADELKGKLDDATVLNNFLTSMNKIWNFSPGTTGGGGKKKDPWIEMMENRMKYMQDFQKGVEKLAKTMTLPEAIAQERKTMLSRGVYLGIDSNSLSGSVSELEKWYEDAIAEVVKKIRAGNKGLAKATEATAESVLSFKSTHEATKDLQKLLDALYKALSDFKTDSLAKEMEKKMKKLSDDLSRTKTAKEFFDKMLGLTGDKKLSATLTMSVYGVGEGDLGEALAKQMVDNATTVFDGLDISSAIDKNLNKIDYAKLRKLLNEDLAKAPENRKLSAAQAKQAETFVKNGEKANADWIHDLYKTYQKAMSYEKQITQVKNEEAQKRKEIAESSLSDPEKKTFTDASVKREAERIAAINLEAFKETSDYLRIFENVEYLSIPIIDRLIKKLREFIATNKELNATDLKNLTEQINKLEEGKARKSAWFAGLGEGIKEWGKAMTAMRKATKGTKEYDDAVVDANKAHSKVVNSLDNLQNEFSQAQSLVENFANAIGVAEDSGFGIFLDGLSNTLGGVVQALSFASLAVKIFDGTIKSFLASNPIGWVLFIVSALIGAAQAIMNARVKKLDREIEGVQRTLDDLEYSFERFEKAQEKAFGTEYIDNYQQKLANLQAQYDAYKKQLETEQEKGKKADDAKVTEYENAMRDTTDAIKDMETELSEYFLGTDLSSAARDFAQAWIDAYKEFGNTADAMSDKFQEMIENMIVESLAAKVMQSVLQPIFDEIDKMSKDGVLDMNEASQVAGMAQSAVSTMDIGMNNLMAALQAAGISVRGMGGDLTGISRDIATASEESILGLAAGINTQNYYISQVPAKMDIIIALLRGEGTMPQSSAITLQDMVTLQNQHLSYLPTIAQHTADTVAECKAIVAETRRTADALERVIKPEGTKAAYKLNTTLS